MCFGEISFQMFSGFNGIHLRSDSPRIRTELAILLQATLQMMPLSYVKALKGTACLSRSREHTITT